MEMISRVDFYVITLRVDFYIITLTLPSELSVFEVFSVSLFAINFSDSVKLDITDSSLIFRLLDWFLSLLKRLWYSFEKIEVGLTAVDNCCCTGLLKNRVDRGGNAVDRTSRFKGGSGCGGDSGIGGNAGWRMVMPFCTIWIGAPGLIFTWNVGYTHEIFTINWAWRNVGGKVCRMETQI